VRQGLPKSIDKNDLASTPDLATEPAILPAPPKPAVSRVDTLPDSFIQLLQQRPVLIGDVIAGRYRLTEALGDGAMGQVFVGENLAIGKKVAIKVLKPELLADATFRQRFQHEAEAMAAIDHRNVARFLDLVVGDPTFLVMEYVRGQTLSQRIREDKRMDPLEAVRIAVRLCWALDAAHQVGVIHRDLKPANIVLCPDAESGYEPKLIDFGLAKLSEVTAGQKLTRHGQIVGTPEYMSPEQIANQEIDGRSDVYSLACLLYEMVAGRPPFSGGDDVQLLYQQMQKPPEPIEKYAPAAPLELWNDVLRHALEKSPDKRFRNMKQMAQALQRLLPRGPDVPLTIPPRPTKKSRWLAALAAGLLMGALIGHFWPARGGGALLLASRPAGARVEIDGKAAAETTPTVVTGLAPGAHMIRFAAEKLQPVERQVTLQPGERALVNVALPPPTRRLEVRSMPEGASVFLDGRLVVGVTPTTIEVTGDDFHELRVEKSGYETAIRGVTPDDKDPALAVPLQPERLARATLFVDSNSAASVWIDGVDTGYTTPTLGIRTGPGEHKVEVHDGAARAVTTVKLLQGQTLRLLLSPVKQ
jgi:tRNA A-37 threonylcarbamoyl transferase component Bud32